MVSHAEIFDSIYRRDVWQGGSGRGSREELTRDYRAFLGLFMRINRITSVVDLGCGDWQFSRHMDWTGIDYLGLDVSDVVLETSRAFAAPGIRFQQANAVTDDLPRADLLIAKDVFQHWSNADILAFLPKLQNYKVALITNGFHPEGVRHLNQDIPTGNYRAVDLAKPPFNLPGWHIYGFEAGEPKWVFLWSNPAA